MNIKNIDRKIMIVRYLTEQEKGTWDTLGNISEKLVIPLSTLKRELKALEMVFPDGWKIETRKGAGMKLVKPMHETNDKLLLKLWEQTLLYHVFVTLLKNPKISLENMCLACYTYPRAVYEVLEILNEYAEKYHVIIERNPIQIIGNERDIRMFLKNILNMIFGTEVYKIDEVLYNKSMNALKKSLNKLDLEVSMFYQWNYINYIFTSLMRNEQGKYIEFDKQATLMNSNSIEFTVAKKVLLEAKKEYVDIYVSDEEIHFLSIPLLLYIFQNYPEVSGCYGAIMETNLFSDILTKLVQEVSALIDCPVLNIELQDYLSSVVRRWLFNDYYDFSCDRIRLGKYSCGDTFEINVRAVFTKIVTAYQLKHMSEYNLQETIVRLNTELADSNKVSRIGLASVHGKTWREHARIILEKIYGEQYEFILLDYTQLNERNIIETCELIISDSELNHIIKPPVYIMRFPLTRMDLAQFNMYLAELNI